ncbi:MAG TPA: TraR/DksA family transcriptional regulator [Rhodocyclaceae bacterium]
MSLTPQELERLRQELDHDERRLLEEVRSELAASGNQQYVELLNRDPADPGDASVADLLANLSLAEIDRHIGELRAIESARTRMEDGSYGTCIDCGRDIGVERLLAYPTAERCLPCQQLHERTYAGQETPTL